MARNPFDGNFDIENRDALLSYLRAQMIIPLEDRPDIRILRGGISNRTVLVSSLARPPFVLKQALPKLRVAVDWYSDPERIHREARGLEWLQKLVSSEATPELLFEDHIQHIIAMTAVPEPHSNWKEALLRGQINFGLAEQFGLLLSAIHRRSFEQRCLVAPVFADRAFFETLRLEPYYRYTAGQLPEARAFLQVLIDESLQARLSLVHGDYSPKNILIHRGKLVLLDHEVIHFGDPAFDVGFSLTHLLSKAHHLTDHRPALMKAAHIYLNCYLESIKDLEWWGAAESRAVHHTLACLLARVAGRSTLEYLTEEERLIQRAIALELMRRPPRRLSNLLDSFSEKLGAID